MIKAALIFSNFIYIFFLLSITNITMAKNSYKSIC